MKKLMFIAGATLLVSNLMSAQNCQDVHIPNRPVPGFISTVRNNFGDEAIGQIYDFDLKPFQKLQDHHITLKFNVAYTYFPGRYDSLAIMVSSDCGTSWENIFYSGGEELSTSAPTSQYFTPTRSEWTSYAFDLYKLSGIILVRYRFINGNGNNLYLDDLGFQEGITATEEIKEMKSNLSPNPIHDSGMIQLNQPVQNATLIIINSQGHEIQRLKNVQGDQITLEAQDLNPGLYFYMLMMKGETKSYGQFAIVD